MLLNRGSTVYGKMATYYLLALMQMIYIVNVCTIEATNNQMTNYFDTSCRWKHVLSVKKKPVTSFHVCCSIYWSASLTATDFWTGLLPLYLGNCKVQNHYIRNENQACCNFLAESDWNLLLEELHKSDIKGKGKNLNPKVTNWFFKYIFSSLTC